MSDWLELELSERLASVRAPEALWARVNRPAFPAPACRTPQPGAWGWIAAAAMVTATLAITFAIPSPSLSQLAAAELAKSQPADFQSADPKGNQEVAADTRRNRSIDSAGYACAIDRRTRYRARWGANRRSALSDSGAQCIAASGTRGSARSFHTSRTIYLAGPRTGLCVGLRGTGAIAPRMPALSHRLAALLADQYPEITWPLDGSKIASPVGVLSVELLFFRNLRGDAIPAAAETQ